MENEFNFDKYQLLEIRSGDQRIVMGVRKTKHLTPFYRIKVPAFDILAEGPTLNSALEATLVHIKCKINGKEFYCG